MRSGYWLSAHHASMRLRQGRTIADQTSDLGPRFRRKPGLGARDRLVDQPSKPAIAGAVDPVPQRLPVHAARLGRSAQSSRIEPRHV